MASHETVRMTVRLPLDDEEEQRRVRVFCADSGEILEGPIGKLLPRVAAMLGRDVRVTIEWDPTAEPRAYDDDGMPNIDRSEMYAQPQEPT